MPRPSLLCALALVSLFVVAPSVSPFAQDAALSAAAKTHDAAIQTPQGRFIQDLGNNAIKIVANKKFTDEQRQEAFSAMLNDGFDLRTIGRFVIGRTWNTATPEQQAEYMDLFKSLVLRTYGSRMALYTGEGFEVVGTRPESELDTTVLSQITHPDGSQATKIDWRVRQKDGKMGVIDVVVEGVSLSVTQKQEYASVIHNNGGRIDGLLQMMRKQVQPTQPTISQR